MAQTSVQASASAGELIERIFEETKKPKDEIKKLIDEKQDELSGLVSEEGAAYIVARELGMNLLASVRRNLKVSNLIPGLRSVDITARVVRVFEPREFSRNGKPGVVQTLMLADETGRVRLPLWNDETKLLSEGKIKEDDVVRVEGGFTKENRGAAELRVGKGTIKVVNEEIDMPKEGPGGTNSGSFAVRKTINKLMDGDNAEIRACIVQVYRRNPFYEVCPQCGKRAQEQDGKWSCKEHGDVEPKLSMVVSGVVDDGYGSMRAVFFREMAEKAFGRTVDELRGMMMKAADPLSIFDSFQNVGKDMVLRGRVKRSSINESLEFVVNDVQDMDVKKECELLVNELGGK